MSDDIIRSRYVFTVTFDWNEIQTWGRYQSVRLVKTHLLSNDMRLALFRSIRDLDLG